MSDERWVIAPRTTFSLSCAEDGAEHKHAPSIGGTSGEIENETLADRPTLIRATIPERCHIDACKCLRDDKKHDRNCLQRAMFEQKMRDMLEIIYNDDFEANAARVIEQVVENEDSFH